MADRNRAAIYEFGNLNTAPSGEHLTARKSTRMKFMQAESDQLRGYVADLEESLSTHKQMLQEILSNPDDKFSPKILEQLIAENRNFEDKLRRITIEKNDAQQKAEKNEKAAVECQQQEQDMIREYEEKILNIRHQSEAKESEIQELERKNKELQQEAEQYKKNKEVSVLPPAEQAALLQKKLQCTKSIMQKLGKDLQRTQNHRDDLILKCKTLWEECNAANSQLKNPLYAKTDIDNLLKTPRLDMNYDEFWFQDNEIEEALEDSQDSFIVDANFPNKFQAGGKPSKPNVPILDLDRIQKKPNASFQNDQAAVKNDAFPNQDRLEKQLNKLKTKVDEMYIKIEALTDELLSMKRLNGQLKEHNTHLKEAVAKSEDKLSKLKKNVPFSLKESPIVEISEITPPKFKRIKGRCNSNPLEYTESPGQIDMPKTARPKAEMNSSDEFNEDEMEAKMAEARDQFELPSMIISDNICDSFMNDSVLKDAFEFEIK